MKNEIKTYSSASNAKRAAKAAGLALDAFDILTDKSGGFYYEARQPAAKPTPTPELVTLTAATATVEPRPTAKQIEEALEDQGDKTEEVELLRKSTKQNPVEWVWGFFDRQKAKADAKGEKISRKGSIELAVAKGIAFYTARTQYQSWKSANKF